MGGVKDEVKKITPMEAPTTTASTITTLAASSTAVPPAVSAQAPTAGNLLSPPAAQVVQSPVVGPRSPELPNVAKSPSSGITPSSKSSSVKSYSVNSTSNSRSVFSMSLTTGGKAIPSNKAIPTIKICLELGDFFGALSAAVWAINSSVILSNAFEFMDDSKIRKLTREQKNQALRLVVEQWNLGSQVTVEECQKRYEKALENEVKREKTCSQIGSVYKKEESPLLSGIKDLLPEGTKYCCLKGEKDLRLLQCFLGSTLEQNKELMQKAIDFIKRKEQPKRVEPQPPIKEEPEQKTLKL